MVNDCQAKYEQVCSAAAVTLKSAGYKFSKGKARKTVGNTCGLIEFQRSQANTKDKLKFTVNVGVVYADLLDDGRAMSNTHAMDSHIRERIGYLMPERHDKWWTIDDACNIDEIEREVTATLATKVIPYIERYLGDLRRCVELWETGPSPGLTAMQRDRLLAKARTFL